MNLVTIAFKTLRFRALASSLTALSVALGIMMMVAVLVIHGIVGDTFSQRSVGVGLVIGPKGSDLGLVLNAIYRVGRAGEPLPYRFYTERLLGKDQVWSDDIEIESAIPLTMGDVTEEGAFPIIGTIPEFFTIDYVPGKKFGIKGTLPQKPFDAVIGARVAEGNDWKLGSTFKIIHGGAESDHKHDEVFTVVGILAPTGTANDKTVFCNIEGFFMLAGHEKPPQEAIRRLRDFGFDVPPERERRLINAAKHDHHHHADGHQHLHKVPDDLKEVSFIFVRTKNGAQAITLTAAINDGKIAQAVNPIPVMSRLMRDLVGNIQLVLLVLTTLIVIVAGIGIFVSIYNSMADRRREIAIMRALGAHRGTVFGIILSESLLLCLGGGLLGLFLGHGLVLIAAPIVESRAGLIFDPWKFEPYELVIFPILLFLGTCVGVLPGLTAYRTDVAQSLAD